MVGLAEFVAREQGCEVREVFLLRHAGNRVKLLRQAGGTIREYTAIQTTAKYDFLIDPNPARVVVVIVQDRVDCVYRVGGVVRHGMTGELGSPAFQAFERSQNPVLVPAKEFDLTDVWSEALGRKVAGWERRERTTTQRSDGGFFHEVAIDMATEGQGSMERLVEDLRKIETGTEATTRQVLAEARVGQGRFREDLMNAWSGKCALTGCAQKELLRASHVMPWAHCSSDKERLDPDNGLLLVANLDAAFDAGLFGIDEDGTILNSSRLSLLTLEYLELPSRFPHPLSEPRRRYLRHHREHVFRR